MALTVSIIGITSLVLELPGHPLYVSAANGHDNVNAIPI